MRGKWVSRVRIARIPTAVLFFCCHKCHTRREKVKKKMEKSSKRKGRKKCFSLLRYADVEWLNSLSVKIYFRRGCNILGNRYIGNNLWHLWQQKCKNSCNTRILARVRVGISLLFYTSWRADDVCSISVAQLSLFLHQRVHQKQPVVWGKVTCCFIESDVLFYRKWRVVLLKVTCCFIESDVLFYRK